MYSKTIFSITPKAVFFSPLLQLHLHFFSKKNNNLSKLNHFCSKLFHFFFLSLFFLSSSSSCFLQGRREFDWNLICSNVNIFRAYFYEFFVISFPAYYFRKLLLIHLSIWYKFQISQWKVILSFSLHLLSFIFLYMRYFWCKAFCLLCTIWMFLFINDLNRTVIITTL